MQYDVIIVGGGIVGCVLACALAQQTALSVAILEAKPEQKIDEIDEHLRVSALSLASQRILQNLKIWHLLPQKHLSPFSAMQVWNGEDGAQLNFNALDIQESALGFIVANNILKNALLQKLKEYSQISMLHEISLKAVKQHASHVELMSAENTFMGKLVIAADGANSWLRNQFQINLKQVDYQQQAIVANVTTSLPHDKTARQVFLPTGPLAFLPLRAANQCSIVWSLPQAKAFHLLELSPQDFNNELLDAFSTKLGEIVHTGQRIGFPLFKQQAANYVKPRLALLGDAVHTIHPLAGQGLNLGLLDAAALVDVISQGITSKQDLGDTTLLRRYERWRRADNLPMIKSIDLIHSVFGSPNKSAKWLRTWGLNLTNQLPILKKRLMAYAVGDRDHLPNLARKV